VKVGSSVVTHLSPYWGILVMGEVVDMGQEIYKKSLDLLLHVTVNLKL
jgi:hypothetical protein